MTNTPTSFAKSLFLGRVHHESLFPFPDFDPAERETLGMVRDTVDRFMEAHTNDFRTFDERGAQPEGYIEELKGLGLFGLIIPEAFGGLGLSNKGYSRTLQEVCRFDGSTALTVGAHSSIGMKGILLFGTDEQKSRYLPRLASGELIAAFCLTEPGSGSDAASIKTRAVRQEDGSWLLTGQKIWITNGAFAGLFTVFARTDSGNGPLTAFIVERELAGVSSGPKEDKMGIRASATTTVSFDQVRLPPEAVLGAEGKGFKVAMSILNNGRTGLGGGCVGAMKRCIEHAVAHVTTRSQFGRPLAEFGLIKEKLARMATLCFVAESMVHLVGDAIDEDADDYSVEAAMSKVFASEALWVVSNEALQIAGGNGFMKEYPYERIVRDSRINMIFEGTNEILRLYIGLSGAKEVGDYLTALGRNIGEFRTDPLKGLGVITEYASQKFAHLTSWGLERIPGLPEAVRATEEKLLKHTGDLRNSTEIVLRRYGKTISDQQLIVRRLADVALDLYGSYATMSRIGTMCTRTNPSELGAELAILRSFTHDARHRIRRNLRTLQRNEDGSVVLLADHLVKHGRYPWDTL